MDYSEIFNAYTTTEGIYFTLKNRRIHFPADKTLPIYDKLYVGTNIAWTILSYNIYNTIDYWWLLCSLNDNKVFYAHANSEILYIKPEYLEEILDAIETRDNA